MNTPNLIHKDLLDGRWQAMKFSERMANIGSEVIRANNWKMKGNDELAYQCFVRAIDLMLLTTYCENSSTELYELCRVKETYADFFAGDNIYNQTAESWDKYFMQWSYAASLLRGV